MNTRLVKTLQAAAAAAAEVSCSSGDPVQGCRLKLIMKHQLPAAGPQQLVFADDDLLEVEQGAP